MLFSHPFCVWTTYTESQLIKIQIIVWSLCFIFITVISDRLCFAIRLHVDQNQALQVQQPAHNGESANAVRLRKSSISTFCVYIVFYFIICSFFAVFLPGNSLSLFQLHFVIFNFPLSTNVGKVISESCYLLLENTRHSTGCQGPAAKYNRKAYLMQIIITEYYKLLTPVHLYLNSTLVLN